MDGENKPGINLPARVTVTLRAGALIALANVICAALIIFAYLQVHAPQKSISVVGYAQKDIASDLIIWSATITGDNASQVQAYTQLQAGMNATLAYLHSHGISDEKIQISSIDTTANFKRDAHGNQTDQISSWTLSQTITVTSQDVQKVADVSRQITDLIKSGVQITSNDPQFIYTKLADLKLVMLAMATADARARANQIASNSGGALGRIIDANMGVFQVNPLYSTDVSSEGNNDTTSYQKTIMAVVHADFSLQ
ncbi:MAG TPA: SIMPL domain-containing protein [Phycisphaerae bacterium]|nr:SIMPL domain-containing protein [Phycisphaerae bacterium]